MISKRFELNGKNAIVAGESSHWAKSIATALAQAGANVAVIGKKSPRLDTAVVAVNAAGKKGLAIETDVTNQSQVIGAVNRAAGELGSIDILVNAPDIQLGKSFLDISPGEWQAVMNGNLQTVINTSKAVGPLMLQQKRGRIINVISCLAERGMKNMSAYCVAMGGILQLTRALSLEWALDGITVNAVGTGWFKDDKQAAFDSNDPLTRYIPAKHYGLPDDIGTVLVYLASNATGFTTGQFMYVDGGLMAHA